MSKKLTEIEEKEITDTVSGFGLVVSKIMNGFENNGQKDTVVEMIIPVEGESDIQVTCQRLPGAVDKGLH